jgi:hypothetical protein
LMPHPGTTIPQLEGESKVQLCITLHIK